MSLTVPRAPPTTALSCGGQLLKLRGRFYPEDRIDGLTIDLSGTLPTVTPYSDRFFKVDLVVSYLVGISGEVKF